MSGSVISGLKPNSSHTFKSLTLHLRDRKSTQALTENAHPDRPYKIKVAVESNKEADRVEGRHLIATAVQATTVVDIPHSPSVAEVLAEMNIKKISSMTNFLAITGLVIVFMLIIVNGRLVLKKINLKRMNTHR